MIRCLFDFQRNKGFCEQALFVLVSPLAAWAAVDRLLVAVAEGFTVEYVTVLLLTLSARAWPAWAAQSTAALLAWQAWWMWCSCWRGDVSPP